MIQSYLPLTSWLCDYVYYMQARDEAILQCLSGFIGRAPKTVKLFINQLTGLGFDEVEQRQPVQKLM